MAAVPDLTVRVKLVAVSADDDAGLCCSCCWNREPITRRALEALGRVVQAVRRG